MEYNLPDEGKSNGGTIKVSVNVRRFSADNINIVLSVEDNTRRLYLMVLPNDSQPSEEMDFDVKE